MKKSIFKVLSGLVSISMLMVLLLSTTALDTFGAANTVKMLDDFDSYAADAGLQAVWTQWGTGATSNLSKTGGYNGTKAMQIKATGSGSWVSYSDNLSATTNDWTGSDGVEFWINNSDVSKIDLGIEFAENSNVISSTTFAPFYGGHIYLQPTGGDWTLTALNGTEVSVPPAFKGMVRIPWDQLHIAEWICKNDAHDPNLCKQTPRWNNMGQFKIGFSPTQFSSANITLDNLALYKGDMMSNPTATPVPTIVPPSMAKHMLTYAAAPVDNPLKGFMPYVDPASDGYYHTTHATYGQFPYSQEWTYLPLNALMNGPDSFTWGPLDAVLQDTASRGHTLVFRVYVDYPNKPVGIPKFLLDGGLVTHSYTDFDNGKDATSVVPNYDDPNLLKAFDNFVTALGARYDGDPRIGFITIGLIGFWGEWHTWPHDGYSKPENWMPTAPNQSRVIHDWTNNFHKTRLLIRYPMADSPTQPIGYHDDSFALETLPPPYPGGQSWMFAGKLQAAQLDNIWQTQPIGGEMRPEIQVDMWNANPPKYPGNIGSEPGQDYYTAVNLVHPSWLLVQGVFAKPLSDTAKSAALEGSRRLGYEFHVPAAYFDNINGAGPLQVGVEIENRGIAPFYYPWKVQLGALDSNGKLVKTWDTDWDITKPLPGTKTLWTVSAATPGLNAGTYTLVMQVINPLTGGNKLRFANVEQNPNGWLSLGHLTVSGTPGMPKTGEGMLEHSTPISVFVYLIAAFLLLFATLCVVIIRRQLSHVSRQR